MRRILTIVAMIFVVCAAQAQSPAPIPQPAQKVEVVNFPNPQRVTGQVSIDNLADLCGERFALLQVPAFIIETVGCGSLGICNVWASDPFDTAGWDLVAANAVGVSGSVSFSSQPQFVRFRNFPEEQFGSGWDFAQNGGLVTIRGAQALLQTHATPSTVTVSHFSVYLRR